jgi:hypothetical protein
MPEVYDLDLDALAPKSKRVKFNDKPIEVQPPKTAQLVKLIVLGQKLKGNYELGENMDEVRFETTMDEITEVVRGIVIGLGDAKLSFGQVNALSTMIIDMAMPGQLEELQKRGISVDRPKV